LNKKGAVVIVYPSHSVQEGLNVPSGEYKDKYITENAIVTAAAP
jgi:hypothetical protein